MGYTFMNRVIIRYIVCLSVLSKSIALFNIMAKLLSLSVNSFNFPRAVWGSTYGRRLNNPIWHQSDTEFATYQHNSWKRSYSVSSDDFRHQMICQRLNSQQSIDRAINHRLSVQWSMQWLWYTERLYRWITLWVMDNYIDWWNLHLYCVSF